MDGTNDQPNSDLIAHLTAWARTRGILPERGKAFGCPHYNKCNGAYGGRLDGGRTAEMGYVGQYYGTPTGEFPDGLRVVMVGLDGGYLAKDDPGYHDYVLAQRWPPDKLRHFQNPHYTGLIRQAGTLLGGEFWECRSECGGDDGTGDMEAATRAKCRRDTRGPERCVLERFAQVNLVKCVLPAPDEGRPSMRFGAPGTAQENCSEHLLAELEELRPKLVLLHGAAFWSAMPPPRWWCERGWQVEVVPGVVRDEDMAAAGGSTCDRLYRFRRGDTVGYLLYLHHPSARGRARRAMRAHWRAVEVWWTNTRPDCIFRSILTVDSGHRGSPA